MNFLQGGSVYINANVWIKKCSTYSELMTSQALGGLTASTRTLLYMKQRAAGGRHRRHLESTFTGSIRTKAHKKFGRKGSVGVSRDCTNFLSTPIISGTFKATNFKFGWYTFTAITGSIRTKSCEQFGRKGSVGVSRECPNFLSTPIISGMGKATNFKFCTHIHRIDRNKSPLKISTKVAVGVLRDSGKFSGQPYIGRIARSSLR